MERDWNTQACSAVWAGPAKRRGRCGAAAAAAPAAPANMRRARARAARLGQDV